MKKSTNLIKNILLAMIYSLCCLQAAFADDTEVFFGGTNRDIVNPNIMFIIDTSGSMLWNMDSESYSDFPDSRLRNVQNVMSELLLDMDNVNVGLMRFSSSTPPGGAVLMPVQDINSEQLTPRIFNRQVERANDGRELLHDVAAVTEVQCNRRGNCRTVEVSPAESAGEVRLDDQVLALSDNRLNAFRFSGINIPQGARISKATLSFTSVNDQSDSASYQVYAELAADSAPLSATNNNISTRIPTSTVVPWNTSAWNENRVYSTNDLSGVVQQVVNLSGWCGGNDLLFMLKKTSGDGPKEVYTADGMYATNGGTTGTLKLFPELRIEYQSALPASANGCYTKTVSHQIAQSGNDFELASNTSPAVLDFYEQGGQNNQKFGIGFTNVNLPQGADITEAHLVFTAAADEAGTGQTKISLVDDATPPMDNSVLSLSAANLIAGPTWSIPPFTIGEIYSTSSVSLTSMLKTLVDKGDWQLKNNLVFVLEGISGNHRAYSFDGSKGKAPVLRVTYKANKTQYDQVKFSHRDGMLNAVESLIANGGTPIAPALAEATQYFKGAAVTLGNTRSSAATDRVSHSSTYSGGTHVLPNGCNADDLNDYACRSEVIGAGATYTPPVYENCQSNNIVYLTDGAPSYYNDSNISATQNLYRTWANGTTLAASCSDNDNCSELIAKYLSDTKTDLSGVALGEQNINMHMIGFSTSSDMGLMRRMASPKGGFYSANDKAALIDVLKAISGKIDANNTTFVTTGVAVNQANRLTHKDELYYSLFTPQNEATWPGNVKKYKLLDGKIVDKNGNEAVNSSSEFYGTATSFWTTEADGNDVSLGGTAAHLTSPRNLYTNLDSTKALNDSANKVNEDNITTTMLRLSATQNETRLRSIHWAQGYDIDDQNYTTANPENAPAHKKMSDPLHSQPTIVTYGDDKSFVFVGTNDGMLHAFNADNNSIGGSEAWSFIPQELLKNLPTLASGTGTNRIYGMDGSISLYHDDIDEDGKIDGGETAMIYVGMRRGGSSYYALDISSLTAPKLKFFISSSSVLGTGLVTSGYERLGQTWSRPVIARMPLAGISSGNTKKLVMIFGGGYDTRQDEKGTVSKTDTVGNIVYIADALTGTKLWSSDNAIASQLPTPAIANSLANMNSVPAQVTAFDLDGDANGYIDHFYVSDTKAQIFRFDVNNSGTSSSIQGGRIASLQGNYSATEPAANRRFFYQVDAAKINLINQSFVSVSIGSGHRAGPLDETVADKFFMIKDKGVLKNGGLGEFDMDVTLENLTDVTSLLGDANGDGKSDAAAAIEDDGDFGWYISLNSAGEKVIEKSITFNNAVIFTSYLPQASTQSCVAAAGGSRIYGMRISDGNPYLNNSDVLVESDRYQELATSGIAPPPQVIVEGTDEGVKARLCVGTQCGLDDFLPDTSKGIIGYKWKNKR